ncbi:MAG TPA: LytTR family DNA-binding domain-containing protein, partial [Chitinophagaceae bacterium]|nr:LytTR family DNA-binding domain-containing protein [Chitinophagaceae bacterium]
LKAALQKWKDTRATAVVEHASISKIEALLQELRTTSAPSSFRDQFLVRKNQKMVPVDINHIGYFSSKSSLTYFITKMKQKHFIDYTLDEVERMVDSRKFNRVNRQFIVAKDMVSAVQPWFNGKLKLDIQLPVEEDIIVSRDKAPVVKEWLGA